MPLHFNLPPRGRLAPWAGLAVLSLGLAWLGWLAAFPSAFLVGPMVAAILCGLALGPRLRVPRPALACVQAVLGCAIARGITAGFLGSLREDGWLMCLVVAATILAGLLVGWLLVRWGRLPGTTAAWGSSPGGASAMVVMAGDYGADVRLVAFMQYLRVTLVVLTATLVARFLLGPRAAAPPLPPLFVGTPLGPTLSTLALAAAAGGLGWRSRLPAGALLLPMFAGGLLHGLGMELALPAWLVALAYAVLGWHVGLGFDRGTLRHVLRALPQLLAGSLLLIGLCALSGWLLSRAIPVDALTAYLATSPGGLDSIAIIALGSEVDLSFIMAVQTLRLFVVILLGPRIARWLSRRVPAPAAVCAGMPDPVDD